MFSVEYSMSDFSCLSRQALSSQYEFACLPACVHVCVCLCVCLASCLLACLRINMQGKQLAWLMAVPPHVPSQIPFSPPHSAHSTEHCLLFLFYCSFSPPWGFETEAGVCACVCVFVYRRGWCWGVKIESIGSTRHVVSFPVIRATLLGCQQVQPPACWQRIPLGEILQSSLLWAQDTHSKVNC